MRNVMPSRLLIGLLLLVSVGVHLAQQRRLAALRLTQSTLPVSDTLPISTRVSPFAGTTVDGKTVAVVDEAPERDVILYWMSPSCVWCQRNEQAVAALAELTRARYAFIAVSSTTAGLQEYVQSSGLTNYVVVGPPSQQIRAEYMLAGTPTTIVLRRDRRVAKVWVGAYTPEVQTDIENFFGIVLPRRASW